MDADFWHWIWERNLIGFHQAEANGFLVRHLPDMGIASGGMVFVPLCGKTRDIGWLLGQGYQVVAAELSQLAVDQLFQELGVSAMVSEVGDLLCHTAPGLRVFVGDLFRLSAEMLGPVALIYDRAALFALPEPLRWQYAAHLVAITGAAPQLLISLVYDQSQMRGPPFSVNDAEVASLYGASYAIQLLERRARPGRDGGVDFEDVVWRLTGLGQTQGP